MINLPSFQATNSDTIAGQQHHVGKRVLSSTRRIAHFATSSSPIERFIGTAITDAICLLIPGHRPPEGQRGDADGNVGFPYTMKQHTSFHPSMLAARPSEDLSSFTRPSDCRNPVTVFPVPCCLSLTVGPLLPVLDTRALEFHQLLFGNSIHLLLGRSYHLMASY